MYKLPKEFQWVYNLKKYEGNPILRPQGEIAKDNIFNPAAAVWKDKVHLICRCVNLNDIPEGGQWSISAFAWAHSDDGIHFEVEDKVFLKPDKDSPYKGGFQDPRLVWIPEEETWVLTYTGSYGFGKGGSPALIALSKDLENWEFLGETFPARAVCIIPQKINGKYYAYYGVGEVGLSWSYDLREWHIENERVLVPRYDDETKFDAWLCEGVASPSISDNGILFLYNAKCSTERRKQYEYSSWMSNTGVGGYAMGWALFDRNDPSKLIARSDEPVLIPEKPFECYGLIEYTIFASGLVNFRGKHHLYYGCADTRIGVAIEGASEEQEA